MTTTAGCEVGLDGVLGTATLTQNGIFTTDSNGEIRISNLAPGAYVLTEVKAPAGYVMDSPSTNVVIGPNGDTQTVIIKNTKKGGLIVEKYDSVTKQPLYGAQFRVTTASGELVPDNEGLTSSNGLYTTNREGQIVLSKLLPGTYVVTEVNPPANYQKDPSPQTVVVNAGDTQTIRFYDDPLCTLTILKRDSVTKKPLPKAEFIVQDSEGRPIGPDNGRFITGTDGTVTVSGLTPNATIVVTESKAPTGYVRDETPKNIVVRTGVANGLIFDNEPATTLIIRKYIEGTENEPLSGVGFKVVDGSGAAVGPDDGTYYTDKAGEIVLDGIEPGTTVIAREIKTVDGFVLDGTPQDIKIEAGRVQSLTFWNKRAGTLVVQKKDKVSGALISGAQFQLTYANGGYVDTDNGHLSSTGLYTTDDKGEIRISGVVGTIVAKEIKAAPGYTIDPATQTQTVTVNPLDTQTLVFLNEPLCSLTITKLDSVKGKPVPGTEFIVKDGEGNILGRYTTGQDGTVTVTGLQPNSTVVVSESKVPDGFVLDTTPQTIVVKSGITNNLTFENDPTTTLIIRKFIEGTNNEPLSGVCFKVVDGSGAAVGPDDGVYFTNHAGEIVLGGIEPGTTVIAREIKTVEGFVLDGTPQDIKIKAGGAQSLTFWNKRDCSLTILKQSTSKEPLTGAVFHVTDEDGAAIGTNNGRYTTDRNGLITITGLQPGQVLIVTEEQAPNGYVKDPTPKTIKIKQDIANSLIFENAKTGSLVINKRSSVDKAIPLEGVTFKVTTTSGEFLPDENGKISSNGLYYTDSNGQIILDSVVGSLVITEIKTIDGYYIHEANRTQTVDVKPDDTQTLYFYNDPLCSLTITKLDSVSGKPVPNTEFAVKDGSGNALGSYTTGKDGTVTVTGLVPNSTVVVTEVKVPEGYVLNQTPQTITVKNGTGNTLVSGSSNNVGTSNNGNGLTFENDPTMTLTIHKYIEGTTNEPLAGVAFRVVDGSGAAVGSDGGIYYTNAAGEIVIDGIEPGTTITAREIKTVDGFVLDGNPQTVKIVAGKAANLTFWNKRAGTLLVQKKDSVSGEFIPGAQFQLTYADGGYVDNDNGHLSSTGLYTTDDKGEIRISGVVGTIVVKEVKAAPGYTIDQATQTQTVTVNPLDTQTLVFLNEPLCSLTITKLDSVKGKPVPGTEFIVKDGEGNILDRCTTGKDGTVTVTGLQPNSTVVVAESKVPEGFVLDTTPQTIVVKSGVTNSLAFENDPTMTLTIRKYIEGTANEPLAGVAFKVTDGSGVAVGTGEGVFYTNEAGEIVIEGLEPGTTVTAREIKTVDGFILDGTPKTVKIKSGSQAPELVFWNQRMGNLIINKVSGADKKTPLAGVQFKITYADGSNVDQDGGKTSSDGIYVTDSAGQIRISNIVGTVVITELESAPGFAINANEKTRTVVVNPGDTQTITVYNDPLCSLTLKKLDSVTGKPIPNTEFTVKDGNGNMLGRYITGKDGTVTVTGLIPNSTVVVTEVKVPEGYVLNQTPQTITVKNGNGNSIISGGNNSVGTGSNGNGLTFENDPTMTLTIHKYIEGTANEPLAGVAFRVVDGSGAAVGTGDGVFYTDAAGKIVIEGLEPGTTITAQEIKTVDGFVLDGTPKTVKITAGQKAPEMTFWNKRAGNLVIRKLDKQTGKPLAGVEFELTYAQGGFVDTDNGHLSSNGVYTTDDHGEIHISDITGTVVVKETRPLPGYTIEPGTQTQTVTVNPQDTQTLTFYNIPANTLTINKYVDGTDNTPLAGVEFLVTDGTGAVVGPNNGYFTTDKDGRIVITSLTPGLTVTAQETKTVTGYILDSTPQSITIREGEAQSMTFWNKPAGNLIINKIDGIDKHPLAGVTFKITYADGSNVDQNGGKTSSNGIYVTDSNGQIKISGITGTVIITEIETIDGYYIDKKYRTQTVEVNADDTQTITVYNIPTQALVIQKFVTGSKDRPLAGVEFLITDSSGAYVGPSNGVYKTDALGRITIKGLTPGMVITARETKTLDGYVLDSTPQSIEIKSGEVQTMTFYNAPIGGLELIKVSEADKSQRIKGVTFEIRKMDGALVDTVTTGDNGRVHVSLNAGDYYCVEIEAAQGFKIDSTPHYFTIQDNKTTTLTVTNKPFSGILIRKIDSVTKEGIYGVTFLLYDSNKNPIGQYSSDDKGYVYIDDLTIGGRYYLRELENAGYIVDTQLKTVYVTPGTTTEIIWENTAITGQIQITKTSADYSSMNGWAAGTPIPGTEFEIYHYRTGNLVDTIRTDKNGVAVSKPLPLGRYKIVESKAADFYGLDKTPIEVEIEHAGQIVKTAMTNKALYTNVSIKKTGFVEVMPGQQIRYDFSDIANNSTTVLTSFYWRDTLPTQAVRLDKIVTGTYNVQGNYKIVYKTNLNGEYRTMYDNLSTMQNYVLDASPAALGLASNECVTEFMVSFGVVPANFRQVEAPKVYCNVVSWLTGGTQFVNQADLGGVHNGQWIMATSRWVTKVYKPDTPLPRTGY